VEREKRMVRPSAPAGHHEAAGFSLLEVLVTIAMITILTGLASVGLSGFLRNLRLRTASDVVKNQLLVAGLRAGANASIPCGVYFDMTNHKSLVFFDDGPTTRYQYSSTEDRTYSSAVALPPGFTFVATSTPLTNNCIVFRGDGSAKAGGSIRIRDPSGRIREISVLASTGRVKVIVPS